MNARRYYSRKGPYSSIGYDVDTVIQEFGTMDLVPSAGNLVIDEISPQYSEIALVKPQNVDLAGKVKEAWSGKDEQIKLLESSSQSPNQETIQVPLDVIVTTKNIIEDAQVDLSITSDMKRDINAILNGPNRDGLVTLTRQFMSKLGSMLKQINNVEAEINSMLCAARMICNPIATEDVQTLPDNDLLQASIVVGKVDEYIDDDFRTRYPIESQLPQITLEEAMKKVVDRAPKPLGLVGGVMTDVKMDVNTDALQDEQPLLTEQSMHIIDESAEGILQLYSTDVLDSTVEELEIADVNPEGKKVVKYVEWKQVYIELVKPADQATLKKGFHMNTDPALKEKANDNIASVEDLLNTLGVEMQVMPTLSEYNIDEIDTKTPIISLDWNVTPTKRDRKVKYGTMEITEWLNPIMLLKNPVYRKKYNFDPATTFVGLNTGAEYTLDQVYGLGSALSGIWGKLKSIHLPSPEHIMAGTKILATGLGIAGSISGNAGLVKASSVVDSLSGGLGEFAKGFMPSENIESKEFTKGVIEKNALNNVPQLTKIGLIETKKKKKSKALKKLTNAGRIRNIKKAYKPVRKTRDIPASFGLRIMSPYT